MKNLLFTVFFLTAIVSCSPSFESVKTVAKTGKSIIDFQVSSEEFIALCEQSGTVNLQLPRDFVALKNQLNVLNKQVDTLVAVGRSMYGLARGILIASIQL